MTHSSNDQILRGCLIAIVILHLVVGAWHGAAHLMVPVPLALWQQVFVIVVITVLPLVGAGLLFTRRKVAAAWLISYSMLASLAFGVFHHFVHESPDHVMAVPENSWRQAFLLSAVLVAVTESIGAVLGAVAAVAWRIEPSRS